MIIVPLQRLVAIGGPRGAPQYVLPHGSNFPNFMQFLENLGTSYVGPPGPPPPNGGILGPPLAATDLSHKHTERQGQWQFEVLTLGLTLGNGSGTYFQASQCIPMGPCRCPCRLTLGVFIPLVILNTDFYPHQPLKTFSLPMNIWNS